MGVSRPRLALSVTYVTTVDAPVMVEKCLIKNESVFAPQRSHGDKLWRTLKKICGNNLRLTLCVSCGSARGLASLCGANLCGANPKIFWYRIWEEGTCSFFLQMIFFSTARWGITDLFSDACEHGYKYPIHFHWWQIVSGFDADFGTESIPKSSFNPKCVNCGLMWKMCVCVCVCK